MTDESQNTLTNTEIDEASAEQVSESTVQNKDAVNPSGRARHAHIAEPHERPRVSPGSRQKKSSVTIGDVRYLDGAELSRSQELPFAAKIATIVFVVIAVVIGVSFLGKYIDQILNEPLRQQETLQENLSREVSLDAPSLAKLMAKDDESALKALKKAGYTLYERTPIGTSEDGGFEVIKLPDGVSVEEAGLMYTQGIANLSTSDAVRLLKGAWTLTVSRKSGTDMRLRYADFDSGTIESAIQNAMEIEGLSNATVVDSGIDESGNTYQTGTVTTKQGEFDWRVSVIDLSEVYQISGLPNTAYYVGIRFTE